jgi:Acetylornithine deacetylase/Succinyl-diaminopimelate desuccinylase and related deacylases
MDCALFLDILKIPSTSGEERMVAEYLRDHLPVPGCTAKTFEVGDGTLNLLLDWSGTGQPSFVFCTHMDTVPPYIPPKVTEISKGTVLPDGRIADCDDVLYTGRGTCDAKGQLFTMYTACLELQKQGFGDFGLLILAGEETGSYGAKAYTKDCPGGRFVLVGEPTDNCMVSASKGTKSFALTLTGKPCHSGYPEQGESAVELFTAFMNDLADADMPADDLLGKTTWNVGKLYSDNPQNVLSPELKFRLYFRTTFATDNLIHSKLLGICPKGRCSLEAFGGDTPLHYFCDVEGIPVKTVSFGSDAPRLEKFEGRAICGPGSILVAHTDREYVLLSDLEKAVDQNIGIFRKVIETYKTKRL